MSDDRIASLLEILAHRRDIVPTLYGKARGPDREVTAERDNMQGIGQFLVCNGPGSTSSNVDAILEEYVHDLGWNLTVRLDACRRRPHIQTSLNGESAKVLGRYDTLGQSEKTDEEHCASPCYRGRFRLPSYKPRDRPIQRGSSVAHVKDRSCGCS